MLSPQHHTRRRQRGLSIVEMMVGVTIGLLVVAGATMVVSTQLLDNRQLMVETQVQQDLRAAADIITRDLRRAGYTSNPQNGVWYKGTAQVACNRFGGVSPDTASDTAVAYRYYRGGGQDGPLGFKLDNGVIKYSMSTGSTPTQCNQSNTPDRWQDLTDSRTLKITTFTIEPKTGPAAQLPCPKLGSDGTSDCWPTLAVRELVVTIEGEAVSDSRVSRRIVTDVRLRNDWIRYNDAAAPTQSCPV